MSKPEDLARTVRAVGLDLEMANNSFVAKHAKDERIPLWLRVEIEPVVTELDRITSLVSGMLRDLTPKGYGLYYPRGGTKCLDCGVAMAEGGLCQACMRKRQSDYDQAAEDRQRRIVHDNAAREAARDPEDPEDQGTRNTHMVDGPAKRWGGSA